MCKDYERYFMRRQILMRLALVLGMAWTGSVSATDLNAGWLAYQSQDYGRAHELWLPAARNGSMMAQNNLGVMYLNGLGVERDDAAAAHWFEQAATQGHAAAQTSLGVLYMEGRGVQRDYFVAFELWHRAAKVEFAEAQYNLGQMYAKGVGVSRNYEKAMTWFRKAAQQGHALAQASQEDLLRRGLGLKRLPFPKDSMWSKFG